MRGFVATVVLSALFSAFVEAPFMHMHERGMEHESETLVHVHLGCAHHASFAAKDEAQPVYLDWLPLSVDFWQHFVVESETSLLIPKPSNIIWAFHDHPIRIHDPPSLAPPALRGPPA